MKKYLLFNKIEKSINELGNYFRKNQKYILNEYDAQAVLFNLLRNKLRIEKEIVHCQTKVDHENIRPDIMIFEDKNIDIKRIKGNEFAIKKWNHNILSAIEIKIALYADLDIVYNKIKYDFKKLKKAQMYDSYIVLLNSSNEYDEIFKNKINNFIKNNKYSIKVGYINRKKNYWFTA